jgi:predicted membrane GTPase involved in stress response
LTDTKGTGIANRIFSSWSRGTARSRRAHGALMPTLGVATSCRYLLRLGDLLDPGIRLRGVLIGELAHRRHGRQRLQEKKQTNMRASSATKRSMIPPRSWVSRRSSSST